MATPQQLENLMLAYTSALAATGLSPWGLKITPQQYAQAAACEAMAETLWLTEMPPNSRNCLGIKAGRNYVGATVTANGTEENADGTWTGPQPDRWRVYPAYTACFEDQLRILREPRYALAVEAVDTEHYIQAECHIWSTELAKGVTVLQIYHAHAGTLQPPAQGAPAA